MSRALITRMLKALEVATTPLAKDRQEVLAAITAAREYLAAPEQVHPAELTEHETVAWLITHGEDFFATNEEAYAMSFAEDERQELVLRTPQRAKT